MYTSASSGGIFTAYALCANKIEYIEKLYGSINITKTPRLFWEVFAKGLISNVFDTMMSVEDNLTIPMCFSVCHIPFFNVRYYWILGKNNRIWKKYFTAATNYPFFKIIPSFIGGRFAIDGGAADNIPIYPLLHSDDILKKTEKPDLIFVLHFDARYDYRRYFTTDIPIIDMDVSIGNDFKKGHYNFAGDVMKERIATSYEYGKKICSKLFDSDCSPEHFKQAAAEIFLDEHDRRQKHFSVDSLLSTLNVLGRTFRNDRDCIRKLF